MICQPDIKQSTTGLIGRRASYYQLFECIGLPTSIHRNLLTGIGRPFPLNWLTTSLGDSESPSTSRVTGGSGIEILDFLGVTRLNPLDYRQSMKF